MRGKGIALPHPFMMGVDGRTFAACLQSSEFLRMDIVPVMAGFSVLLLDDSLVAYHSTAFLEYRSNKHSY